MSDLSVFDILMMSDLRFPGGTSSSIAQEIRAQASAGYRTGLVHVHGPRIVGTREFNPLLRDLIAGGAAELVLPGEPVRTRLALLRHPSVFTAVPAGIPTVIADEAVLVVNQPPRDLGSDVFYDVDSVDATLTAMLGKRPLWAPIGPAVRPTLHPTSPLRLRDEDWYNIIDVDEWAVDRSMPVGDRPVIGRHSRPDPNKWPSNRRDISSAYPKDQEFRVRILGGANAAGNVLGRIPASWDVLPYGDQSPQDFLAGIDFFVYFHDPEWIEAFGRTVLEALASGAVAILPKQFRETFGDAAVYAEPHEVPRIVRELHADWPAYLEQSQRGQAHVRRRFGHEAHLDRVRDLIGAPSLPPRPTPPHRSLGGKSRVMFVSSNGSGMGHLTRLLAYARRASGDIEPMFVSLSQAVGVVASEGFAYEYIPSRVGLDVPTRQWNPFFAERFESLIREHRPRAVVFDGTWPYDGLMSARENHPELLYVWSRRGMWKPDAPSERQLDAAKFFDLIVEPGDFAAAADRGATARASDAITVPPVMYLDESELLSREAACAAIGLDPTRPTALVTLGAGNINDLSSELGAAVDAVRRHPDWQVAATRPIIATGAPELDDAVHSVSFYPLSKYSRAFDFAIAAGGYNSYHELIGFGVPAIFVPNLATRTDDQLARCAYAEEQGVGLCVPEVTIESMTQAVDVMVDDRRRAAMALRCHESYLGNGAAEAMRLIERALRERRGRGGVSATTSTERESAPDITLKQPSLMVDLRDRSQLGDQTADTALSASNRAAPHREAP